MWETWVKSPPEVKIFSVIIWDVIKNLSIFILQFTCSNKSLQEDHPNSTSAEVNSRIGLLFITFNFFVLIAPEGLDGMPINPNCKELSTEQIKKVYFNHTYHHYRTYKSKWQHSALPSWHIIWKTAIQTFMNDW